MPRPTDNNCLMQTGQKKAHNHNKNNVSSPLTSQHSSLVAAGYTMDFPRVFTVAITEPPMSSTQSPLVPADDVKRQLQRILDHPSFRQANRISQMLRFVVEETLAGRGAELKQYTVAVRGLGLPAQFDPQDNALIRIHARRLRQMLEHYYQEAGRADPVRITLDRGGYVPLLRWNTTLSDSAAPAADGAPGQARAAASEHNGGPRSSPSSRSPTWGWRTNGGTLPLG